MEDQVPLHLPNGQVAYVPKEWGPDQVKDFLGKITAHPNYVAPSESSPLADYAGAFAHGAVTGAASLPDIPANLIRYGSEKLDQARGVPHSDPIPGYGRGVEGWVSDHLPDPPAGYEGTRRIGHFAGMLATPGGIARGGKILQEGRGALEGLGILARGAGRDMAVGSAAASAGAAASAAGGAGGRAVGNLASPAAGRVLGAAGEVAGDLAGGLVGGGIVHNGLNRAAVRRTASPGYQENVRTLQENGVPLTAGDETGSMPLRRAEDNAAQLPGGSHVGDIRQQQTQALSDVIRNLMGYGGDIPGGSWTPDVWNAIKQDFTQRYTDLTSRNQLVRDPQLSAEVAAAQQRYNALVPETHRSPRVQEWADNINNAPPIMAGDQYQGWHSQLSGDQRSLMNDTPTLEAIGAIKQALVGNMGRSVSPADRGAWQTLDRNYSAYKTAQRAMQNAGGVDAQNFELSMPRLRMEAARKAGPGQLEGNSDVGNIARAAQGVLTPPRSSGTAERSLSQNLYQSGPAATTGAAVGAAVGGVPGAAVGSALGGSLPAIVNSFVGSPLGQRLARSSANTPRLNGGPMFDAFQRYAPTIAGAAPIPVQLPTIHVRGQ